jgi:type IV pilus assembly protein PilE
MQKNEGFTLIELLIVIAIVGIIAAISYPTYTDTVRRTNRVDTIAALSQLSQAMERFYGVNYTYQGAAASGANTGAPAANTFAFTQSPFEGTAAYNLTISASTSTGFTVSAVPIGVQLADVCGTLTLTSAGARGDGSGGTEECWR